MRKIVYLFIFYLFFNNSYADTNNLKDIIELLQKDLKTLERAVYSNSFQSNNAENVDLNSNGEEVLTRHLLKLSEIEKQFNELTNRYEEINFKLDKLSTRLTKIQADYQYRFQNLEKRNSIVDGSTSSSQNFNEDKILPGSSLPQDLGSVSYKDMQNDTETQQTQSIDTAQAVLTEEFVAEEKILPNVKPAKQYEFATSFLKNGDYNSAERAFREFVETNPDHNLAGNAQYWYAETFRIRQLYTDAATAYLEGYQKYPKAKKHL